MRFYREVSFYLSTDKTMIVLVGGHILNFLIRDL